MTSLTLAPTPQEAPGHLTAELTQEALAAAAARAADAADLAPPFWRMTVLAHAAHLPGHAATGDTRHHDSLPSLSSATDSSVWLSID